MSWDALPGDVQALVWRLRLEAMAHDVLRREHALLYEEHMWYWPLGVDPFAHVDRIQRLERLLRRRGNHEWDHVVEEVYTLYDIWRRYYE